MLCSEAETRNSYRVVIGGASGEDMTAEADGFEGKIENVGRIFKMGFC